MNDIVCCQKKEILKNCIIRLIAKLGFILMISIMVFNIFQIEIDDYLELGLVYICLIIY